MEIILELRDKISGELFDHQMLIFCLRKYKKPRDKISLLLKSGSIIQIKRGLYAFGPPFRKGLLSQELVSSLLVQPSYLSKEYALYLYGILPERVDRVTCMTTKRKKHFDTPIGHFDYYSLSQKKFCIGVTWKEIPNEGGYLLATKEKALADWIASMPTIPDKDSLRYFLYNESRVEEGSLQCDVPLLKNISNVYQNKNVELLSSI